MGFLELLTIIFIILKILGYIDWSWLVVLSPMFVAIALYIVMFAIHISIFNKFKKF
ncbi:hypothetical protein [Abyssicoccus albus]|uniref:hypothetical protein n=1 Tax=Abyssicoccus albus TaxID=1817405 RepID=UPI00178CEE60|nr:hypothetical protein [Abyssicoccus albus]